MPNNNTNTIQLNQENQEKNSYILKVYHKKNFTTLDNGLLYDNRLSAKATGYLCIMLSFSVNWKINIDHLAKLKTDGIDAVKSALNELKSFGYVYLHRPRNEKGQLLTPIYLVSEFPMTEEDFKKFLPQVDFPLVGQPLVDNPPITNTNIYINTNNNKSPDSNESIGSDDPHLCSKYLFEKVKMIKNNAKEPKWIDWDKTFEKMIRIDKIPKNKIIEAIDFVYRPKSTWVIQSPDSLRAKYEKIDYHLSKEVFNKMPQTTMINNDEDKKISYVIGLVNNWLINITNDPLKVNMGTLKIEDKKIIGPHGQFFRKNFNELMRIIKDIYKAPDGLMNEINKKCFQLNKITDIYKQSVI